MSDESKAKVQKFLQRDKSLREYVTEIEKLKKLKSEVASLPVLIPMHLFLLDCTKINKVGGTHTFGTKINKVGGTHTLGTKIRISFYQSSEY